MELRQKLRAEESEKETLKQKIIQKAKEKEEYVLLNFELQKELRTEKSETEKLKQKNKDLERRIAMLHGAEDISKFHQNHSAPLKKEYIKTEIKSETYE